METVICFIDDSDFEHDLVRTAIAPVVPDATFLQAYTFEEAEARLSESPPELFLLDLWGQDESVETPQFTSREELEARAAKIPAIADVFDGLADMEGDRINPYLKRLFTIVDGWRNLFEDVCARVGQNRKYGLRNLDLVRRRYPGVPAVFYTRKSLISDAVAMFQARADGLFIKPTGATDEETRRLTREYAPQLLKELRGIIQRYQG
jgi:DNA-binding NarL/FixJ family response regulator